MPIPPRTAYLDRTDPNVAAIAGYVLRSALDPLTPAHQRPARRCGVMRTTAVTRRTTLLLVRYRTQLELPGRDGTRQLVAEDAKLLAYRGRASNAEWLSEEQARELASAADDSKLTGTAPQSYGLERNESVRRQASRSWLCLLETWQEFRQRIDSAATDTQAAEAMSARVTRERWLHILMRELGFRPVAAEGSFEIGGKNFPVSHRSGHVPIHLRLILERYDAMAEAARNGTEYQTVLDPPPGQGPRHLNNTVQ